MAGNACSHTKLVKEPGAIRRQEPGLKIKVKESVSFGTLMLAEEFEERLIAEVMNHSGRSVNLARVVWGKGVAVKEEAGKILLGGKAVGFLDEAGIEIDASEFNAFAGKRGVCGEPANVVPNATTDVDDAKWAGKAAGADCGNDGTKNLMDARSVIELLGQALHFPMNSDKELVDFGLIEIAVVRGKRFHGAKRLTISVF